ncbi:MAG: leucine-rich repeat protein [Clostridia bacterium]|nr:leucine-rich repeat protein [Clostridia bacterium]
MNEKLFRPTRFLLAAGLLVLVLCCFSFGKAGAERLVLPASTLRIEEEAFCGDTSLDEVVLNEGLIYIGPRAFANSSLKLLVFPSNPIDISLDAFDGCPDVQALVAPDSWAQLWCYVYGLPYIALSPPSYSKDQLIVKNGASLQVELDSPSTLNAYYTWSSDNESVLTVDENGLIFGEYPGTATLTVSLPDGSGAVQIPVLVQANYRALLFSESTYRAENLLRNRGDVLIMKNLLNSVTGPDGGLYSVRTFNDLTAPEVFQKITDLLEVPSREGDVSLFFFASHGDPGSADQEHAGRLWCIMRKTWVALPDLANALLRVKGKVIVILESCGPGAAMHDFDGKNPFITNGDKFSILTAAGYMGFSKLKREGPTVAESSNAFPYYLGKAIGTSGAMPADTNGDGIVTVQEWHKCTYNGVYQFTSYRNGQGLFVPGQLTCVWPSNDNYPLFKRK